MKKRWVKMIGLCILAVCAASLLAGCRKTHYTEKEAVKYAKKHGRYDAELTDTEASEDDIVWRFQSGGDMPMDYVVISHKGLSGVDDSQVVNFSLLTNYPAVFASECLEYYDVSAEREDSYFDVGVEWKAPILWNIKLTYRVDSLPALWDVAYEAEDMQEYLLEMCRQNQMALDEYLGIRLVFILEDEDQYQEASFDLCGDTDILEKIDEELVYFYLD